MTGVTPAQGCAVVLVALTLSLLVATVGAYFTLGVLSELVAGMSAPTWGQAFALGLGVRLLLARGATTTNTGGAE